MMRKISILITIVVSAPAHLEAWYYAGRIIEPKSRAAFFRHLNNAPLAVVQLYQRSCKGGKQCNNLYQCLKERLSAISQNKRFNYAQLNFILMDVSCDSCLARDLGVANVPSLLVFKDGRPVTLEGGAVHLDGVLSEIALNEAIENWLHADLDIASCERAEYEREREQAQLAAWAAWAPYWYAGCYRPGWGWSGRCGWGWGCGGCW